ncbi:hypothetical protein G9U51_09945 [Calidifontibacter sp. DB0510]|uniref:Uncharacterized protein n=1 Tax=Metallococcus carri TaxID=1656884 RepID=A0A967B5Q7_9MICO|nr:hypothetical protein [Metallococcus carri]NHN56097.1 hypothetical protein [Metallococcus carri]NOP37446.1 hypothetical protein [Calidifontibacter sp. DB2511S]
MSIFRRKRTALPEPDPEGPRDEHLPMLSVDEAAAVARLVRERLAMRGREGVVGAGALRLDDGTVLGLHNLATALVGRPYAEWPAAVDRHLRVLMDSFDRSVTTAADPRSVYVRLRATSDLPAPVTYDPAEPLPGIVAILAVDEPHVVRELLSGDLTEVGGDRDTAYRNAWANLAALPVPAHDTITPDTDAPNSMIHVFTAEDFFGASRLVVLPSLLERAMGAAIPPHGVLVAVPNRHLLLVHFPQDESVLLAAHAMIAISRTESSGRPGPISSELFHVTPDLVGTRLSSTTDDGVSFEVTGPVEDMFRSLGLLDDQ